MDGTYTYLATHSFTDLRPGTVPRVPYLGTLRDLGSSSTKVLGTLSAGLQYVQARTSTIPKVR